MAVFASCLIGIHSRLLLDLASFWPANAVLLSILLLKPPANNPLTWLLATAAYIGADLISGTDLRTSLLLNGANLATIAGGCLAARLLPADTFDFAHPIKVLHVVLIIAAASTAGGIAGMFIGPLLFGLAAPDGLTLWWATECVNLAIVLPIAIMMAMPPHSAFRVLARKPRTAAAQILAFSALLLSVAAATALGGPGAIAMPLPVLIWCAVIFRPAVSTILASLTCTWFLVAVPYGWVPYGYDLEGIANSSSFRMGVAMILIAQFAVAGVNAAWRKAHAELSHMARHDALTGISNRAWALRRAEDILRAMRPGDSACLMMIDIDNFKSVNDGHGHLAGDAVIVAVARALDAAAREGDVVGRLGGEEFMVLLCDLDPAGARIAAERLRRQVEMLETAVPHGPPLRVTVSIGASPCSHADELGDLLTAADLALYDAKRRGRNRVAFTTEPASDALANGAGLPYMAPIRSAGG